MGSAEAALLLRQRALPLVRRPLLMFPLESEAYRTRLPWTLPEQDRRVLRADSWGITMPGAPIVPGGSTTAPERILSWFLDRYPIGVQAAYLARTASYGYTHVKQSLGDLMGPVDNGPQSPPGSALTIDQVAAVCQRIHRVRSPRDGQPLSISLMLGSKYFHPHDMTPTQFWALFQPILEGLWQRGALKPGDELLPAWEWNLWNVPGDSTIVIFQTVGRWAHAHGLTCWFHGSPGVTWWGADGTSRYTFWDALGGDVDGLNYQTDPRWSIAMLQARIVDTLHQFGEQGDQHLFRFDEDQAALEFDSHPAPDGGVADEDEANTRGYCACCTIDDVKHTDAKVWGYGNGGRRPDGWVL